MSAWAWFLVAFAAGVVLVAVYEWGKMAGAAEEERAWLEALLREDADRFAAFNGARRLWRVK